MLTPSRFVVVDDKPHHLQAIMEVFQELGTPCLGITFDPATDMETSHFSGVRALFLDLHLLEGVASSDDRRHYAHIVQILEQHISPHGGPFVLVIWTEHAHLVDGLTRYIDETLDASKPHARPLSVMGIAKESFINVASGKTRAVAELRKVIENAITANPQIAALVSWETEVLAAAGATLATLLSLVPAEERATASYPAALDSILSRLAREAVGRAHVAVDPHAAIAAALAPILADRIVNQPSGSASAALWAKAVTRYDDKGLGEATPDEAGQINRMLHVAQPQSEAIRATDWGAVVEFPSELWKDKEIKTLFGLGLGELLGDEFKIPKTDRAACQPRLVRVGAACDHAQNRRGPLSFLFGLEIPVGVVRQPDTSGSFRPTASEWLSPRLLVTEGATPVELAVNARYVITKPRKDCERWKPVYRLREQLLMHLIAHTNGYVARPGIISL